MKRLRPPLVVTVSVVTVAACQKDPPPPETPPVTPGGRCRLDRTARTVQRAPSMTMNAIQASSRVAQIVTEHPACARLFAENKIDFCCHGDVALADACAARGLDIDDFLARVRTAATSGSPDAARDATESSTPELIAYLVSRHHAYLRRTLPALEPIVAKVARVHGDHNPKLQDLLDEVRELRAEIEPHLDAEESDLFPMLMSRRSARDEVARRLADTREEHERVGRSLARIRTLSDDFRIPDWGCGSYRMMMSELAALEEDTLRHVHLENHVLMPRFEPPARNEGESRPR